MIAKITKWLLLIIVLKLIAVLIMAQYDPDPRRETNTRKKLCDSYHPNVVFIGTSRTLYGVDPALFDSLNHNRTRSYNFGILSLSPRSAFHIAEEIISDSPTVKTIYIELSALDYSTVALNPKEVIPDAIFRANLMANCSSIDWFDKTKSFLLGLNTTLFQALSIAPQITNAKKIINPVNDPIEGKPELRADGHQSVALALPQVNDRVRSNHRTTQQLLAQHKPSKPNTYYISKIKQLIENARLSGKHLIFFYPNNFTQTEYLILSQIAPYLPQENLIRLPAGTLSDQFFEPENLFDPHHLNQKGASVYTKFLQEESLKRLENL